MYAKYIKLLRFKRSGDGNQGEIETNLRNVCGMHIGKLYTVIQEVW